MTRSPFTLAALAAAAVPGLDARSTEPRDSTGDVDVAVVRDATGRPFEVRAPRTAAAGVTLEAEMSLLAALARHVDDDAVPFAVPTIVGTTLLPEGGHAVVCPLIGGATIDLERLAPGPGLTAEVGRAIAAIHELPPQVVEDAGLPAYTAEEYRERRLVEVDEAASTGNVPFGLLRRWEAALEDVSLWRFRPVPVHGDLGPEQVRVHAGRVVAVTDWGEARVADPADDLAWLVVSASPEVVETILEAYAQRRVEAGDPHLARRARLIGELALARWLLHGVRTGQPNVVADARDMLEDLDIAYQAEENPPT